MTSMNIVLFITDLHTGSRIPELAGIREVASQEGWHIEEIELQRLTQPLEKIVAYWDPLGCIFEGSSHLLPKSTKTWSLPHVHLDPPEEIFTSKTAFVVMNDDLGIAELAHRELARQDCASFAFIGWSREVFWSRRRLERFRSILSSMGKPCTILEDPWTLGNKNDLMSRLMPWIAALPKPCGIFAVNDDVAAVALEACRRLNLTVPLDVRIVGTDDNPDFCDHTRPSLSSIRPNFRQGGRLAAELLAKRLADPTSPPETRVYHPFGVTTRLSTRVLASFGKNVGAALDLIRREACSGLKAADVVKALGVSERIAETRFKAATGNRITEEITRVRLARVLELLANPRQNIGPIANLCGWDSDIYLKRLFKARYGMTMREWRESHSKGSFS